MKTITVKLQLKDEYKYIAHQPWGSITAFLKKPEIDSSDAEGCFWALQDGEIELSAFGEQREDWKDSVVEI